MRSRRAYTTLACSYGVLRKDLLRVSRRGGRYQPQFIGPANAQLAASILETFRSHVGTPQHELDAAIEQLEREETDFKLVRGLRALCERETTVATVSEIPPDRIRRVVFAAAESADGVASSAERDDVLKQAAKRLGTTSDTVAEGLYADRSKNQILTAFEPRWDADGLCAQYNLSLAQTALFDATEVRIRSDDPKALISALGRLRLLYEIERTEDGRVVVITGPNALFRRTRRYGTAFARLLRTVAQSALTWELVATIDDRGSERTLTLHNGDITVPESEPIAEPTYDSAIEADFAARFTALESDWELQREPEPLETGHRVMIPDFAFDYAHSDFRVYFEVMGFWTPEYIEKKLTQIRDVEDVELIVAVDESLGVGEMLKQTESHIIPYTNTVRVKDVVDVLRSYETQLLAAAAETLPAAIEPSAQVTSLEAVATAYGVSVKAIENRSFPAHVQLGQQLVSPTVLETISDEVSDGMTYADVESIAGKYEITETSALLSAIGYRVEWDGLSGGTVKSLPE